MTWARRTMTVVLDGELSWPPPVQVSAAPAAPAAPEAALAGGVNNFPPS